MYMYCEILIIFSCFQIFILFRHLNNISMKLTKSKSDSWLVALNIFSCISIYAASLGLKFDAIAERVNNTWRQPTK